VAVSIPAGFRGGWLIVMFCHHENMMRRPPKGHFTFFAIHSAKFGHKFWAQADGGKG
jgi:hypothetical protein